MSTVIQRRRGTTAQHATFTGMPGETTIDTTKNTVVVHDGATVGGFPLAKSADISGKMDESVYDPQNKAADAFARANHTGTQAISTVTNLQTTLDAKAMPADIAAAIRSLCQGRLTLTSGTPVTTSDVTAATTLYFTPYKGNQIGLYSGGVWAAVAFTENARSLAGLTTTTPYDIFVYNNAGTATIDTPVVWANDTVRVTALALQDGVYVKNGDPTRRYIGTIYTSATGQCEDSLAKRYVWNMYNRVLRPMRVQDATATWTYTSLTLRQVRASAANQLDFVRGISEDVVRATATNTGQNASAVNVYCAIGLDGTTAAPGSIQGITTSGNAAIVQSAAIYDDLPSAGRHTLKWLEASSAAGTTTWNGSPFSGIEGILFT